VSDDEILDVVDEMGRHIGSASRRAVHTEGLWHQVAHILLVAERDGVPTAVLQRRADHKATFPGLFDLSATGHLTAGESPRDGVRELYEELGIVLAPEALVPLGVRRIVDEVPEGVNRELCHVFLVRDDRPLADYSPDPEEVSAVVDLPIAGGLDLVAGAIESVNCGARRVGAEVDETLVVRLADLVPEAPFAAVETYPPGYWTTLLVMAERFAAGDGRLAI
jgi:isopentenyldiphosphate isomerase